MSALVDGYLRVRIIKPPVATDLEGFDVSHSEVGRTYDVGPRLGTLLIVCGFAEPDAAAGSRSGPVEKKRNDSADR